MAAKEVKVTQASGKKVSVSTASGKQVEIKDDKSGFKEGDVVTAYSLNDTVQFKVKHPEGTPAHKMHVDNGTVITLHELDAQILAKAGRGEIVKA